MNQHIKILFSCLFAFFVQSKAVFAQLKIERKIIIEKEQYYFFTIDEETQLATLYTGSIYQKLNKAKKYRMPIGREANEPLNPLCFDINNGELIGINWILNSNNSRYEAIKKIDLNSWKKPHPDWTIENWAQVSFDQPMLAPNEPWQKMLEVNNVLDNTFFDLIISEGVPVMAVCNQNQLWISRYKTGNWERSETVPVNFKQHFSVAERNGKVLLMDQTGDVYAISEQEHTFMIKSKSNSEKLHLLIFDKDKQKVYTVSEEAILASMFKSMEDAISESAKEIIF